MEEARQHSAVSDPLLLIVLCVVIVLFGVLGVRSFAKARQGVRTGTVVGLLLVNRGKRFERDYEPEAFQINVLAGFIAAVTSALIVLLAALSIWMIVLAYFGLEIMTL